MMVTDTVRGCNRDELVSQLSMFRRKFPELPDLPQPPTAGHILDSCSLTLHGNTLSHDLWGHVFVYSMSVRMRLILLVFITSCQIFVTSYVGLKQNVSCSVLL